MRAARAASRDRWSIAAPGGSTARSPAPRPIPASRAARCACRRPATKPRFAIEKKALEQERVRLLYVALTRAADLLVLPIVTADPGAGSLQSLWQATLPEGVVTAALASPAR